MEIDNEIKAQIAQNASNYMQGRAMALSFKPLTLNDVKDAYKCGAEDMQRLIDNSMWWKTADGEELPEIDREVIALTTQGKVEFHRGRVEVRAKMPSGKGTWAAIWMFGRHAAPSYSELDILEYVGCDKNIIYTTVHTTATLSEWVPKSTASKTVGDVEEAFHVYGMLWQDQRIQFYLDNPDNVYLTFDKPSQGGADYWPFDSDEYLILNLAVGGDWGAMRGMDTSIWPQSMEVDYVRIFQ